MSAAVLGAKPATHLRVLEELRASGRPRSVADVAAALGVRQRSVWESLRRLWAAGFASPVGGGGAPWETLYWRAGAGAAWEPAPSHLAVLAALVDDPAQAAPVAAIAVAAGCSARTARVALLDLQAAGCADSQPGVPPRGGDMRRRAALWSRTPAGRALAAAVEV